MLDVRDSLEESGLKNALLIFENWDGITNDLFIGYYFDQKSL